MPTVLIVQAQMKRYRIPFFRAFYEALRSDGINLKVAYSPPLPSEAAKNDTADLPEKFSICVPGKWALRGRLLYQPLLTEAAGADLVIVEHANKHLLNHWLVAIHLLRKKRFALWGLGLNKQEDRSTMSEWYKRATVRWADWYFAYTRQVATEIAAYGVPPERITAVQNSVDTGELQTQVASVSASELKDLRRQLGMQPEDPSAIYCGMLDPVKGISLLIDSAKQIREKVSGFHLLVVGGGAQLPRLREEVQALPWIHVLGPKFGHDKAALLKLADAFLLPGRAGLAILDCFAAHLPLITVNLPIHGPEIEYLEDGVNGMKVKAASDEFAAAVIRVLKDATLRERLRQGAAASAQKYSIEAMVGNFRNGVRRCLSADARFRDICNPCGTEEFP